ncbi:MAG: hypothetical protein KDD35_07960, partial [Bdellovibrionales bacterium]|nr:hypothetical protein [Bdellovibrionales bacterium]
MAEAVVFQGLDALDYGGIRANVVRIPEVASRLLEAQEYWDKGGGRDFDLFNFVSSDDQTFLSNIRKKSLASAVVQLGLYDRYLRHHPVPQIFVGNSNGDPALLVVAGVWNFQELVTKSQAL